MTTVAWVADMFAGAPAGALKPSNNAAERAVQLATECERLATAEAAELAELALRMEAVRARTRAAIAAAESAVVQKRDQLAAAVVADFHKAAAPLARQLIEQPTRAVAIAFTKCWRTFEVRARVELGAPLRPAHVAHAIADALIDARPSACNAFGLEDWGCGYRAGDYIIVSAVCRFSSAAEESVPDAEDALAQLEHVLSAAAARTSGAPDPIFVRRYLAKRNAACFVDEMLAIEAANRAQMEEDCKSA